MRRTFSRTGLLTVLMGALFLTQPQALQAQAEVSLPALLQPSATVCGGDLLPTVVLASNGLDPLATLRINYLLDGNLIANYNWSGMLTQGQRDTIAFPALNLPLGLYELTVYTENPNGSPDPFPANDTIRQTFEVTEEFGEPAPFKADFDQPGFPYDGYVLNNPDAAITWALTDSVSVSGASSLFLNNYNYNGIGQVDELTLPGIDMTSLDKSGLSFFLAYAPYGVNSGFADTLEIYVSGDCGQTFERVYRKWGADLATSEPTTGAFFPRGSWDWRKEWIDLSDYAAATFLVVRFRHVSNYENNLFIDRVRVERIFSLAKDELTNRARLSVSADPWQQHLIIQVDNQPQGPWQLRLLDLQGRTLHQAAGTFRTNTLEVPMQAMSSGAYLLEWNTTEQRVVQKVIWR